MAEFLASLVSILSSGQPGLPSEALSRKGRGRGREQGRGKGEGKGRKERRKFREGRQQI